MREKEKINWAKKGATLPEAMSGTGAYNILHFKELRTTKCTSYPFVGSFITQTLTQRKNEKLVIVLSLSHQSVSPMGFLCCQSLRVPGWHSIVEEGTGESIPASRVRYIPGCFDLHSRLTSYLNNSRKIKAWKCCTKGRP